MIININLDVNELTAKDKAVLNCLTQINEDGSCCGKNSCCGNDCSRETPKAKKHKKAKKTDAEPKPVEEAPTEELPTAEEVAEVEKEFVEEATPASTTPELTQAEKDAKDIDEGLAKLRAEADKEDQQVEEVEEVEVAEEVEDKMYTIKGAGDIGDMIQLFSKHTGTPVTEFNLDMNIIKDLTDKLTGEHSEDEIFATLAEILVK